MDVISQILLGNSIDTFRMINLSKTKQNKRLQFFHMIEVDCKGGETTLVDSFHIAKQMIIENPKAFYFLSTNAIPFHYIDESHHYTAKQKIFNLDENGNLVRFNYNNDDRSSVSFPLEKVI